MHCAPVARPKVEQSALVAGKVVLLVFTGCTKCVLIWAQPLSASTTACNPWPYMPVYPTDTGALLGVLKVLTAPTICGPPACPACAGVPSPGENARIQA